MNRQAEFHKEETAKERLAFEETLARVSSFGIKPGLKVIQALLKEVGDPQAGLAAIHITGTNGKGSVSAMLEAVLRHSGYRTGLFTSPHMLSYRERFRVDGQLARYQELLPLLERIAGAADRVEAAVGCRPTEFEVLTALGFLYFQSRRAEVLILEVGMGGRYDSTNVIPNPLLTVITNVTLDHENYLGKTIQKIAWEKAGILKAGVPAVWAGDSPEALAVLEAEGQKVEAGPLHDIRKECTWTRRSWGLKGQELDLRTPAGEYPALRLPLNGWHQGINVATALRALELLAARLPKVRRESIYAGLEAVRWPCRLELVQEAPAVVLDGSHNPAGILALARWLRENRGSFRQVILVMGMVADKDRLTAAGYLDGLAERVIITRPLSSRAGSWEELGRGFREIPPERITYEKDCQQALALALAEAGREDLVLCTGSFYLVGELRGNWQPGDMF